MNHWKFHQKKIKKNEKDNQHITVAVCICAYSKEPYCTATRRKV